MPPPEIRPAGSTRYMVSCASNRKDCLSRPGHDPSM